MLDWEDLGTSRFCGKRGIYTMKTGSSGPCLSAVFVDYDNIYLSLKRKSEEAAKRFAKDAGVWIKEVETGGLISPTNGAQSSFERRIVMNRCYGNPVPRRNSKDNSTDVNSFAFVRHHFLRAGFEIADCPPLTAQLKNSSDIRMVMDIRDFLTHDTYYDEFIILSGDADFTPVLHRLRAHARRTVIFANDHTATPYTAISDGEVRESDLIDLLVKGHVPDILTTPISAPDVPSDGELAALRRDITAVVVATVKQSGEPVPIETLADRAQRTLGPEKTIETEWGGHGAFRTFLIANLPDDIQLTEQAPYLAYEPARHAELERADLSDVGHVTPVKPSAAPLATPPVSGADTAPIADLAPTPAEVPAATARPATPQVEPQSAPTSAGLQHSIARIHEACQAPPFSPQEYRLIFEMIALELNENGLSGAQTVTNIAARVQQAGLDIKRDDVRFVLDVVSEADPWFEQGASANLFAGRFRNFVVARCRGQGLNLSADELDLIDAWFAGAHGGHIGHSATEPMAPAQPGAGQGAFAGEAGPSHSQALGQPAQPSGAENSQESGGAGLPRMLTR